jgi:hypothetical protein
VRLVTRGVLSLPALHSTPPRVLTALYEQLLRDDADRRLGTLGDLQAAIASAFGGEDASKAVNAYREQLSALSEGRPLDGESRYTSDTPTGAIAL